MSYVKACFFSLIVHMNFLISRRGSAWWIAAFVSIEPLERVAEPFAAHSFWTLHCCGDLVGRKSWSKISLTTCLTTYTKFGVKNFIIEAWLNLVERCVREHRTVGMCYRAVCGTLPLTLHRYGDFVGRKSWSKISLTTYLTTFTKFGVKNSIIETWLSLVERCVREHRTVGALRRAVYRIFPLTLHRYGDFVGRKSWSKISLTTYLTTFTRFEVKISIIETWLSLVERCVRDAEVACSNHVVSTN